MKKTLKELALEMGYKESDFANAEGWKEGYMTFLQLDPRHAIFEDEKGLHLTDLVSWASFAPRVIGRKSNVTESGLNFQLAQYRRYLKQIA